MNPILNRRAFLAASALLAASTRFPAMARAGAAPSAHNEQLVRGLIAKMTLTEKLGQMTQLAGGRQKALNSRIDDAALDRVRQGRVGSYLHVAGAEPLVRLQRVAVKRADLSKLELSDLHREVAILRKCSHPHLLPLLGYCLDASAACLVFPLMVGGSLQTRLDLAPSDCEHLRRMGHFTAAPKPLTWRQRLRVVAQATEALVYLHERSIVHRDFKPANILLDTRGGVRVSDFGISKQLEATLHRMA